MGRISFKTTSGETVNAEKTSCVLLKRMKEDEMDGDFDLVAVAHLGQVMISKEDYDRLSVILDSEKLEYNDLQNAEMKKLHLEKVEFQKKMKAKQEEARRIAEEQNQ